LSKRLKTKKMKVLIAIGIIEVLLLILVLLPQGPRKGTGGMV